MIRTINLHLGQLLHTNIMSDDKGIFRQIRFMSHKNKFQKQNFVEVA